MKRLIHHSLRTSASFLTGIVAIAIVGYFTLVPQSAATVTSFTVNSTLDLPELSPGDGVCNAGAALCTLRAAITESNYSGGANVITVPSGNYTLTLGPADDEFNGLGATMDSGDLDIMDLGLFFGSTLTSVTINGAGAGVTIIDGGGIDRVLDINNFAASGKSVDVTLNGLTIRNGNAATSPDGYNTPGGGIQFDGFDNQTFVPTGTLTINNCNITNNSAAGQGGGILAIFGSLDMDGSEVSGNTSVNAAGGGISYDGSSFGGLRTFEVTNSRIHNNHANNGTFGNGGGVWAGGNANKTINYNVVTNNTAGAQGGGVFNSGSLTMNYNVIVDNTASANPASSGLRNNTGPINAENNWWGCNQGPTVGPCNRVSGPLGGGIASWLKLSHTASPNAILVNQSTTLQADFFTNNLNTGIAPSDLVALNGRPVVFNNPVLGTISAADPTINGGKANATFTAGPTGGSGSADATVDHATVTALITISQAPETTTDPSDQTACEGSTVSFTAAANGFPAPTVQWQVSTNGGGTFTDIPGATSTTLSFTANASQNGNQYRAVFTNAGGSDTTNAATLTVNTAPAVTTNPTDVAVCEGATASFTAAANGSPAPSVQWQVSTGGPFTDIPGETNNTLSFTATASQNGNRYRVVFTNTCGSATTTAGTLTVNANTSATTPGDQTVCQGATATFSTTASGAGPFSYQWKLDGTNIAGATGSSVAIDTTSVSVGNHTVDVVVTGACGPVTRSSSLTVQENTAASKPDDQTVCQGATANFSTTATGTNLSYQWKLDGNNIAGATNSSVAIDTTSVTVGNHTVEVVVSGTCGTVTKSATLTVQQNTTATTPGDQIVCKGANATFTTTASGANLTLQWKLDGSNIAGATGSSVVMPTGSLSAGNHTVEVVASGSCGTVTRSATLTVHTAPAVTLNPQSQTVTNGGNVTFTAGASGQPTPTVQWQVSTNGGASFSNIPGATSTSLTFATNSSQNGNQYRAVFTNECGTVITTAATLTTCTPADVTGSPASVADACVGSVVTFNASATGFPTPTVQWQVSTNGGGTWTNISGATSPNLSVTASVAVRNNQYRAVFTNACGTDTTAPATLGVDTIPPVITLSGNTISLWPPNHDYHTINISSLVASATDGCSGNLLNSVVITSVSSDETQNGNGDGNTNNDIIIAANCKSVQLRAERQGGGNGRVYRINLKVTDSGGNVKTATAKVYVPKNQNGSPAVDDGPANGYTVTSNCP